MISRQSTHEGRNVVSPTPWPHLKKYAWRKNCTVRKIYSYFLFLQLLFDSFFSSNTRKNVLSKLFVIGVSV
jgi:hypothetical protein